MTIALLSSFVIACSTHTAHKKVVIKDKLIRGSVITFEKRVTIANPYKTLPINKRTKQKVKGISVALVKKADVATKPQSGRSIASTCEFVKFCKLSAINLRPQEPAEIAGDYTVLTSGIYNTNATKSWALVNGEGKELKLICGVQAREKTKACSSKLSKLKIKDIGSFIENLMEVRVTAAK